MEQGATRHHDGVDTADLVLVTIPAHPRHAATARVVASSLSADAGFDVDEIDDLRLAVNEVIALLTDEPAIGPDDCVDLEFLVDTGTDGRRRLQVTASRTGDVDVPSPDDLATRILSAVVDHFDVEAGRFRLVKYTATDTAGQRDAGD